MNYKMTDPKQAKLGLTAIFWGFIFFLFGNLWILLALVFFSIGICWIIEGAARVKGPYECDYKTVTEIYNHIEPIVRQEYSYEYEHEIVLHTIEATIKEYNRKHLFTINVKFDEPYWLYTLDGIKLVREVFNKPNDWTCPYLKTYFREKDIAHWGCTKDRCIPIGNQMKADFFNSLGKRIQV